MSKFRKILMSLCVIAILIAGGFIGKYYYELLKVQNTSNETVSKIESKVDDSVPNDHMFDEWYQLNNDYVGWLKWDSGVINTYLLRNNENDDEYYLHHDINKEYVLGGSPIIDWYNNLDDDNVIIYGHSVFTSYSTTLDLMFSPLRNMVEQDYYEANKTFKIYWKDCTKTYEVFAVCDVDAYNTDWNYKKTLFDNTDDRDSWIKKAKNLSSINGDNVEISDGQIVTLQTCKYWQSNERIVVVAIETEREGNGNE